MDLVGMLAGIGLGLIGAWTLLVALLWVFRPRDARLGEVARIIPDVLRLVRNLLADRSVPLRLKLALVGLLAWLVNTPEGFVLLGGILGSN